MIELTTLGSRNVTITVGEAALPEAEGGVTVWVEHWVGAPLEERVAYTLTRDEAMQLVRELACELFATADGGVT